MKAAFSHQSSVRGFFGLSGPVRLLLFGIVFLLQLVGQELEEPVDADGGLRAFEFRVAALRLFAGDGELERLREIGGIGALDFAEIVAEIFRLDVAAKLFARVLVGLVGVEAAVARLQNADLGCVVSTTFAGPLSVSVNSRVSTIPLSRAEDSGVLTSAVVAVLVMSAKRPWSPIGNWPSCA